MSVPFYQNGDAKFHLYVYSQKEWHDHLKDQVKLLKTLCFGFTKDDSVTGADEDDGKASTVHLIIRENFESIGYARLTKGNRWIPDYVQPSFSRLCVSPAYKGMGVGSALVLQMLDIIPDYYPKPERCDIVVRPHLVKFYSKLGFDIVQDVPNSPYIFMTHFYNKQNPFRAL